MAILAVLPTIANPKFRFYSEIREIAKSPSKGRIRVFTDAELDFSASELQREFRPRFARWD